MPPLRQTLLEQKGYFQGIKGLLQHFLFNRTRRKKAPLGELFAMYGDISLFKLINA